MHKLKIKKDKVLDCIEYIATINNLKLTELDFSELATEPVSEELLKEWKYTGLDNWSFVNNILGLPPHITSLLVRGMNGR